MSPSLTLIIAPSPFLLDERVFLSLGILKVAASLEQAGYPVSVLDLSGVSNYTDAARVAAREAEGSIFGVTATTPQMPAATKIAQAIREERPDARLILGGPHVTLCHAAAKGEERRGVKGRGHAALEQCRALFDVLVAGDGEDAIFQAIAPDAPGLIDADDPKGALFLTRQRLDELPFPARHLVDMESYHYEIDECAASNLIAQLGCPMSCNFCSGRSSPSLRRMRLRSSERVIEEVEQMHAVYGYRGFNFFDDELNINPKMCELMGGLVGLQDTLGVDFRFRGFLKSELVTHEQADTLYRAGFRWVLVGFESGSERILRNINKKATRDDNSRCMEIAHGHGLKVKALMSIGHPGESPETVAATRDWLLEVRPDDFDATIITTYPGSPYYDEATSTDGQTWTFETHGDKLYAASIDYTTTADYYKGDPDGGYTSYVWTDAMSAADLVQARDEVEREVRGKLGIPAPTARAAIRYEHSMGMGLPWSMLRRTEGDRCDT